MGHGGSLLHQRFRIAQRDGQRAELQAVDELLTGLQTAGHVKGDHAASALHLLLGNGVLGIGFQEGIADRFDLRIGLQPLGDLQSAFIVLLHADTQRLETAAHQKRGEGRHDGAKVHEGTQTALPQELLIVGDHRAAQQVTVAADVLGEAVDDCIHAQIQRGGIVGRGKGVVDKDLDAVLMGDLHHGGNIHQHHGGVGGRLHIDQFGVGLDQAFQLAEIGGVKGIVGDPEAGQPVAGHVLRAGIFGLGENSVVAAFQQCENRAGDSAHAGRIGHGLLAVFQRRQLLLQIIHRGIGDPAVCKALGIVIAGLHRIVRGIKIECGRLINGRDQGTVHIPRLAGVDLYRVEFQIFMLQIRVLQN